MKKTKLFLPLLALALSIGIVGCSNNGGDEASNEATVSENSDSKAGDSKASSAPKKESIKVSAADNKTTLSPEETVQLVAKVGNDALDGVTWTSSDPAIASVSNAGLVTALKVGSVSITASKEGYTEGKINLTIKMPEILVQIESGTSEGNVVTFKDSHNVDTDMVDSWPQNAVLTLTFAASKAGAYELHVFCRAHGGYQNENTEVVAEQMEIKVNDADVALSGNITGPTFTDYKIGETNLIAGNNVMTVKCLAEDGNMTTIDYFNFVYKA